MGSEHIRFLLLEQGVGAAVFNFFLNGLIAWVMFRGLETVPLWGQQGIAGDTIGTCFFLPFFTALIVTALVRRRVRAGGVAPLGWTRESHPPLGWLPVGTGRRGLVLGTICAILIGPVTLWLLVHAGVVELPFWTFVGFKASFSAVLAFIVTPIIALWAITSPAS